MFKICLCFTIISLCTLAGLIKSYKYSERVRELDDYIKALRELSAEMSYRLTPLQELLGGLSCRTTCNETKAFHFFGLTACNLATGTDISQAWNMALNEECSHACALAVSDKDIIRELSSGLGCTGIADQRNRVEFTIQKLSRQLEEAEKEASGKGTMYKKLGILMGITAAVLII